MGANSADISIQDKARKTDPAGHATPALINKTVDRRLTSGRIPNVTVYVNSNDRTIVKCGVRAIGSQEIVLIASNAAGHPTAGDSVTFSLYEGTRKLLTEQTGIVHWATTEGDTRIVALFSGSRLDQLLDHRLIDDRRLNIRYPVDIQALVTDGDRQRAARIVNYSLHGVCLVCNVGLEVNRHYPATLIGEDSVIRLSIEPKWIEANQGETDRNPEGAASHNLTGGSSAGEFEKREADAYFIGCDLLPQYGELLARRHTSSTVGQ